MHLTTLGLLVSDWTGNIKSLVDSLLRRERFDELELNSCWSRWPAGWKKLFCIRTYQIYIEIETLKYLRLHIEINLLAF